MFIILVIFIIHLMILFTKITVLVFSPNNGGKSPF